MNDEDTHRFIDEVVRETRSTVEESRKVLAMIADYRREARETGSESREIIQEMRSLLVKLHATHRCS